MSLIIALLWVLVYGAVLAAIGWIVIYALKLFGLPISGRGEQLIWLIVGLIVLIWLLTVLSGHGSVPHLTFG